MIGDNGLYSSYIRDRNDSSPWWIFSILALIKYSEGRGQRSRPKDYTPVPPDRHALAYYSRWYRNPLSITLIRTDQLTWESPD